MSCDGILNQTGITEHHEVAGQQCSVSSDGSLCVFIVQELCESRGGRPELSVLTSFLVSVDVKLY